MTRTDRASWTEFVTKRLALPKPAKRGRKPRRAIPHYRFPTKFERRREWVKEADRIWSLLVRASSRLCFKCHRRRTAHADHLVSRRYSGTRWLLVNGCPLCAGCHQLVTSDTAEHVALAIRRVGEDQWTFLNTVKYVRADPRTAVVVLTATAAGLGVTIARRRET